MILVSYAINIIIGTILIYLSIEIVDRANYRNKLSTAFFTAIILSLASKIPFIFFFGLIIWIYILINWYSIGFFKSFLCALAYAFLSFLVNLIIVTFLLGGNTAFNFVNKLISNKEKQTADSTREKDKNPTNSLQSFIKEKIKLIKEGEAVVYVDADTITDILKGQRLKLELEANPTTGYNWQVTKYDGREFLEQIGKTRYIRQSNLAGGGGIQVYYFKGIQEGHAEMTFEYKRPWEKDELAIKKYIVQVNVCRMKE